MFTKAQIDNLLSLAINGDNNIINEPLTSEKFAKRFLLELKIQIERWNYSVSTFIFHPCAKCLLISSLGIDAYEDDNKVLRIWGSEIYFSPLIPINRAFAFADNPQLPRQVSVGIFDSEKLERLLNLKAFW